MKKIEVKDIKNLKEKGIKPIRGFIEFFRSQSVIGLAVGVIMATSVTKLVTAFVTDIVNPIVGLLLGHIGDLKNVYLPIGSVKILFGSFFSSLIDFIIVIFIVYFTVKLLGFNQTDKKK